MPEIKLNKRVKYAGDVLKALVADGWNIKKAAEFLATIPDADAVPVVRCKDCKHRDWRQSPEHGKVEAVCKHPGGLKNPRKDGFCGYGERKDNATD